MKLRFFKRMFVEKEISEGGLKIEAGSLLSLRPIFFRRNENRLPSSGLQPPAC